jgi:hypothetical protein
MTETLRSGVRLNIRRYWHVPAANLGIIRFLGYYPRAG